MASHRVDTGRMHVNNQVTSRPCLYHTLMRGLNRCMEEAKHLPGSSITVKLFLSRTNSQQWSLMKELELGKSNERLSYKQGKQSSDGLSKHACCDATATRTHRADTPRRHPARRGTQAPSSGKVRTVVDSICLCPTGRDCPELCQIEKRTSTPWQGSCEGRGQKTLPYAIRGLSSFVCLHRRIMVEPMSDSCSLTN